MREEGEVSEGGRDREKRMREEKRERVRSRQGRVCLGERPHELIPDPHQIGYKLRTFVRRNYCISREVERK